MRFLLVLILCLSVLNTTTYAADELNMFDTSQIEQVSKDNTGLSFKKMFYDVIDGNGADVIKQIYKSFIDTLIKEVKDNSIYIRSIILISILCGILNTITIDLKDRSVSDLMFYVGQILILTIAITAFKESISILKSAVDSILKIIISAIPLMTGIVAACGKPSSLVTGGVLSMATGVLTQVINGIVVPLITASTLVSIVNIISSKDMLSKMSALFKDVTGYIVKGGGYLFVFLMGFERLGGGAVNKMISGSAKSAVGAVPVVGDVIKGGMDIATNVAGTVATGSGIVLVILLVACAIVPMLKILVITAIYKVVSAVVEPICDKGTVEIIDCVGEGCKLIMASLFMVLFMFVVSVLAVLGGLT